MVNEDGFISYYESLKTMATEGQIDIKLIISPPRTGSTLMESSFSMNEAIDAKIHEPFIVLRKEKAEVAYKNIYNTVISLNSSQRKKNIIIKEMSHWLTLQNEYEQFLTLVKSPIIILIRNPLLNTESKIKKILETLDLREKQSVRKALLDYYAHSKKEKDWTTYLAKFALVPDNKVEDEAVRLYRRTTRSEQLSEFEVFPLQRWLLDYYAISKGYKRWKVMLKEACDAGEYKKFEEILKNKDIYDIEGTGWRATARLIDCLENKGHQLLILDSTDYRLSPETIVPLLCKKWEIPFSENMIHWGEKDLGLYTGQAKSHQSIWYDRLQHSKKIELPTEHALPPESFPDFIAHQIMENDLPMYVKMMRSASRIKPSSELLLRKKITDQTICEIDPIFAYLSDPTLLDDRDFMNVNSSYLSTLEKIKSM